MAKREQKPVFINNDMFGGTFRRDHSGDYHCTRMQVKAMLCDQTDNTMDMEVLDDAVMEDLIKKQFRDIENVIGHYHSDIIFWKKFIMFQLINK